MLKKISILFTAFGLTMLLGACSSDNTAKTEPDISAQSTTVAETGTGENILDPSAVSFALYDIDGNLRESSEWVGKQPLVVNFWGTWCPPCRKEIPELVRLYDEYKDQGIEMVGLAMNDKAEKVKSFAEANNMNWIMLLGDRTVAGDFGGITGVPTTIFIDKNGKELGRFVGPRSYEVFKEAFEALLQPA